MKDTGTISRFINYLKNPIDEKDVDATFGSKVKTMFLLFLFSLLLIFIHGIISGYLKKLHWIEPGVNAISTMVNRFSYLKLILVGVVTVPVFEELLFRLPLRYKNNYLLRWTTVLISKIARADDDTFEVKVHALWNKYFKYFFYFIILLFGCFHFFNFSNYRNLWPWIIVLVFPQLVTGTILGYIRVRFSLPWSMAYHALYNCIFFSFAFLSFSNPANNPMKHSGHSSSSRKSVYSYLANYDEKNSGNSSSGHKRIYSNLPDYEVKNADFSFSMNKGNYTNAANGFRIVPGKVIFENYKLAEVLEIILERPRKYFMNTDFGDMAVNVSYITKQIPKDPDYSLRIVSDYMQKAMKVTFTRQLISKDVWELYIADPIQYQKAVLPLLASERHYSLSHLGEILDKRYPDVYIMSSDLEHQFCINQNIKWPLFAVIKTSWKEKYGLGFRKVKRNIEFININ